MKAIRLLCATLALSFAGQAVGKDGMKYLCSRFE